MVFRLSFILLIFCFVVSGCKKEEENEAALQISISHKVDSQPLQMNSMMYTCDAGYQYEVTKLNYYLSHFVFTKSDGSRYESDTVLYVDAAPGNSNTLLLENFPPGNYTGVSFYLGLDSVRNITNGLPTTTENINMIWPDVMGGGYHFMKLEGHYKDNNGTYGFAIHLGKNSHLVLIHLNRSFGISANNPAQLNLTMNINEWFRNPEVYDFNADGNYSMSNDTAMNKLSVNGSDIFN